MPVLAVTERKRRRLTAADREAISASAGFWSLADTGYVSYRRGGNDVHEIVGHKYVGRATIGELEVRVDEKATGVLLALVNAATGAELRIHELDSPETEYDVVSRHLMRQFVKGAGAYVASRRRPRYEYRRAAGPALAGSLSLPDTLRLNASGRLGHFAYEVGRVVRDEPLDRLVLAGLDELDRAASALGLDRATRYEARWLGGALEEVRDAAYMTTRRETFLTSADAVEQARHSLPEDVDLARLAAVALLHRGFERHLPATGTVPRAWFVDLETLFEQAVRETLRLVLDPLEVDRGEAYDRRVFVGGTDHSRAHPDLVVHSGASPVAVGDVKYKNLRVGLGEQPDEEAVGPARRKEGRPDLYQLLVHAESLSAGTAFLVYVSDDEYVSRYLGKAATGAATWTVQVRPLHLGDDLQRFTCEIGLGS